MNRIVCFAIACALAAGCAGRGKVSRPPAVVEEQRPAQPQSRERAEPVKEGESTLRLPGQNRLMPSEMSGARGPAPETALPRPAASDAPAAPDPEEEYAPPPVPIGQARYRVQIFATATRAGAMRLRDEMTRTLAASVYVEHEPGIWKVRVGNYVDRSEAESMRRRIAGLGHGDCFVVEVLGR